MTRLMGSQNRPWIMFFCMALFLVLFLPGVVWALPTVMVDPQALQRGLSIEQAAVLIDHEDQFTFRAIGKEEFVSRFIPEDKLILPTNRINSSYWTTFSLKSTHDETVNVVIDQTRIRSAAKITLYKVDSNGKVTTVERIYESRISAFVVELPPREKVTCYIHYRLRAGLNFFHTSRYIVIHPMEQFTKGLLTDSIFNALFFGAMMALLLYNAVLALSLREAAYLWYCLYIGTNIPFWLARLGVGESYLWGGYDYFTNAAAALMLQLIVIFAALFARSFLETRRRAPKAHIYLSALAAAGVGVFFYYLFVVAYGWPVFPVLLFDMQMLFFPAIGLYVWWRGYRPARLYTAGWLLVSVGAFVAVLFETLALIMGVNTVGAAQVVERWLLVAVLLESILLALALAERYKVMQEEKEMAEAAMHRALEESHRDLGRKVAERTAELYEAMEQAEEATKLKDKFVSMVSHDLRGPIGTVKMSVDHLDRMRAGDKEKFDTQAPFLLRESSKALSDLLGMIQTLLDVSLLQSGKITPVKERVDTATLAREVFGHLAERAREKEIELTVSLPEGHSTWADKTLLATLFSNLVGNGVKFALPGGVVEIGSPKAGSITVISEGSVIDETIIDKLFDPNIRTTTRGSANEQGTGLGLPHCADIMKAHGGAIRAENGDRGALFTLDFPEAPLQGEEGGQPGAR